MDTEDLRMFLRVAERGSFTAASRQLRVPLTTISRRIKRLEDSLGVSLFYRTTRHVRLTEEGQTFYSLCVKADDLMDEALRAVHKNKTPEGLLSVLMPYSLGQSVVEPHLGKFRNRYPKLQLALTYDNKPLDLIEHGFDIALRSGPVLDSSYSTRLLGWSRAKLVASPDYLATFGTPVTPVSLPDHHILFMGTNEAITTLQLINKEGQQAAITVRPRLISNDNATILREAVHGSGIALVSKQLAANYVAEQKLNIILPEWQRASDMEINAIYPQQALANTKVKAFLEFLTTLFGHWMMIED